MIRNNPTSRHLGNIWLVFLVTAVFLPWFLGGFSSVLAKGYDLIQEVATRSEESGSVVLIRMTGHSAYRIIPIEDHQIMLALKDMDISETVFGRQVVLGDSLLKWVDVRKKPSKVACVVIGTKKPNSQIQYEAKEGTNLLRVEFRGQGDKSANALKHAGASTVHAGDAPDKQGHNIAEQSNRKLSLVKDGPAGRDTELFREAVRHYKGGQFDKAMANLEGIIQSYPKSRHLEPAHFLLAKSFHRKFADDISKHLIDIVQHYQVAISRFPESEHVPKALLSMADCYFQAHQYYEAMTYYNLVLEKSEDEDLVPKAMFQRARVLAATKKPLVALQHFENLQKRYPKSSFAMKASLEMAKTLFDLKSFNRSLKILEAFLRSHPDAMYQDPQVLLYMGYNHYELGQLQEARQCLSEVVNLFPQLESTDLVLTRIADALREDGMEAKAIKMYDLVARTYPDSEGSAISLIRLAEQAERKEVDDSEPDSTKEPGQKESKTARQIYQEIVERFPDSALAHVAMLKLGNLDKKTYHYEESIRVFKDLLAKTKDKKLKGQTERALQDAMLKYASTEGKKGHHRKSIEILKELLVEYPHTDYRAEVKASLEKSLLIIFNKQEQEGRFENLVSYYEQSKGVVPFQDMPKVLLQLANAYKKLHLYGPAYSMYKVARRFYEDRDLPADSLFGLAECALKDKKFDKALESARIFTSKYPGDHRVPEALYWMGQVLYKNHRYKESLKFLKAAATQMPESAIRVNILLAAAKSSNAIGDYDETAGSLQKAIDLLKKDKESSAQTLSSAYRELGETHVNRGERNKALAAFTKALESSPKGSRAYSLEFRVAQCYQWTKAMDKAEEMLSSIVASGDPFWSKVAQTQINEIGIQESMETIGVAVKKS